MLYSKIEGIGTPLLIIHGFLGMGDNWKTLAGKFAQQGFEVHTLDLRNHGRSFHSDEFNYEVMAKDIDEYVNHHKFNDIMLLGHSMGGKAAMLFAADNPEKVSKLIIADIGPKFYPEHHQDILAGLNAVDFSRQPSRSEVESVLDEYINDSGTKQFLLKSLFWKTPGQLAFRFNLEAFNKNIKEIGKELGEEKHFDKPVLFLRGEKSGYIKDEDFEGIKRHFPKAQIKTIAKAGHWLHAENPNDFIEESLSFLKDN